MKALAALLACAAWLGTLPALAAEETPATERVQVATPYIELRTGPGRGYPVFHVAERRQWVVIELRRTDWYRVRVEGARNAAGDAVIGWVQRCIVQT